MGPRVELYVMPNLNAKENEPKLQYVTNENQIVIIGKDKTTEIFCIYSGT